MHQEHHKSKPIVVTVVAASGGVVFLDSRRGERGELVSCLCVSRDRKQGGVLALATTARGTKIDGVSSVRLEVSVTT
jgi:hypothetical protein